MWKQWAVLKVAGLLPQITYQEITDFEYFLTAEHRLSQRNVDADMLNVVKNMLADVSAIGPSSEELRGYG